MTPFIGTEIVQAEPREGTDGSPGYNVLFGDHRQWMPKDVFESVYSPFTGMTAGAALEALKAGLKVRRAGFPPNCYLQIVYTDDKPPVIYRIAFGCLPVEMALSSDSLLASDWEVLP